MKIAQFILSLAFLSQMLLPLAQGKEYFGENFSENLEMEGSKFYLFGAGLRSKLLVKIYVGGLFVNDPKISGNEILESAPPKVIKLIFKRHVSADTIRKAWTEGFARNCSSNCPALTRELEKINAAMTDMAEHDTMAFYFGSEKVMVFKNDQKQIELQAPGFGRQLLAIFIGAKPADDDLKKGMLAL